MSLLVLTAAKGSPGVTTAAVALTAVWPRRALLAECDPAGGDLALRLRGSAGAPLARDRGMVSLATATRANPAGARVGDHVQPAAGGLPVLIGPATMAHAVAIGHGWDTLAALLADSPDDVVADCGRLQLPGPVAPILRVADAVALVVRPSVEGVAHLRAALISLLTETQSGSTGRAAPDLAVVVIGDAQRGAGRAVSEALACAGLPEAVVGCLADDPRAAAGLAGEPTRSLDRSPLIRSARALAHALDERLSVRTPVLRQPSVLTTGTSRPAATRAGR